MTQRINVFPGTNPQAIRNADDPSGFRTHAIHPELCEQVADVYEHLLAIAPSDIVESAIKEVPVYIQSRPHIRGSMLAGEEKLVKVKGFIRKAVPTRTFISKPLGIALNPDIVKNKTRNSINSLIAHELIHYMTYGCINSGVSGIDELLVRRIESAHFNPIVHKNSEKVLAATTGFRCRDYFRLRHSRISADAMYRIAKVLAPSIQEEQAWKIYQLLLPIRKTEGVPRYEEIAKAVSEAGGIAGRKILRSPLATMARPGIQHVVFRADGEHGPEIDVHTFGLKKHLDAGNVSEGKWSDTEFVGTDDTNAKYSVYAFDEQDVIVGKYDRREALDGEVRIHIANVISNTEEAFAKKPKSVRFRTYHGNKIGLEIPLDMHS